MGWPSQPSQKMQPLQKPFPELLVQHLSNIVYIRKTQDYSPVVSGKSPGLLFNGEKLLERCAA